MFEVSMRLGHKRSGTTSLFTRYIGQIYRALYLELLHLFKKMTWNIKRSKTGSSVEMQMNLESVIQSIVNQKEKTNINAYISHVSKVMLKISHARLQHYMNQEFPDIQAGFRKGRGTRDQTVNIHWIIEKAREFQKNIYFCFIDYAKAFDCVDHNKLRKALKEMGIQDHLTCLLRNLHACQEATVRTLYEQLSGSGLKKQYNRAVCCHSV